MLIFHFAALPVNDAFAAGILPAPARKLTRSEKAVLDAAWNTGWTAAAEGGSCVMPPASFTDAEAAAFFAGADSATWGSWSDEEIEERAEQARREDAMACGFVGA
jgi:hypothetical protein